MGNGSRLTGILIDTETAGVLDQATLEAAAKTMAASFGKPSIIMMPANMGNLYFGPSRPEYAPTAWKDRWKLTKREVAVAKLHTVIGRLIKIDEDSWEDIVQKSMTRLKRAKWAQYKNLK